MNNVNTYKDNTRYNVNYILIYIKIARYDVGFVFTYYFDGNDDYFVKIFSEKDDDRTLNNNYCIKCVETTG